VERRPLSLRIMKLFRYNEGRKNIPAALTPLISRTPLPPPTKSQNSDAGD
jgi:hypothetical protein